MKKWNTTIGDYIYSLLLAAELSLLLDTASVLCGRALSVVKFGGMYLVLALLLLLIPAAARKVRKITALTILTGLAVCALVMALSWNSVSRSVVYQSQDDGKARLYGGRNVMLLVPHQDDDINVLGGVLEEYVKYGSDVRVVFSTNGDYAGLAEVRFQEALNALENAGIPKDHVIFLGYGDQWAPEGPHLYNAEPGQQIASFLGMTETYGTAATRVWRKGRHIPLTISCRISRM